MTGLRVLLCHVLLFGIAFSSPVETKEKDKKIVPEVTTQIPPKGVASKSTNNEQIQSLPNEKAEKSSTKKRNVPRVLADQNEYLDDDFYGGRMNEDYDGNQAFKTILENSRNDNLLFDLGKYKVNDNRYRDYDSRRKRTVPVEGVFRRAEANQEPEIRLSPEDLMMLAAYQQQRRLYSSSPYGRWNDIPNAIDIPEEEPETDEAFDGPEHYFDRYYDQRYQNWANLPKSNKFMSPQGKDYPGYPKLRVPPYKRAFL